jgi:AcrR family transcriptional regulator
MSGIDSDGVCDDGALAPVTPAPVNPAPVNTDVPATERGSKKRATRSERRHAIRKAAYKCFAQRGYHGTTIDDICEACGLSKGSFYWYFKSKSEVFVDILETWAIEVEGEMARQFRSAMQAEQPFVAIAQALAREARRSRRIVPIWVEFIAEASRDADARKALSSFYRRLQRVLTELLELALDDSFSPAEVSAAASTALAGFFGLLCQEVANPDEAAFEGVMLGMMGTFERLATRRNEVVR